MPQEHKKCDIRLGKGLKKHLAVRKKNIHICVFVGLQVSVKLEIFSQRTFTIVTFIILSLVYISLKVL